VWKDIIKGNPTVFFKAGSKGGHNFKPVIRLSEENNGGYNPLIKIIANRSIFVSWISSQGGVSYVLSKDGGSTFGKVNHTGIDDSSVSELKLASSSKNVYLLWKDNVFSILKFDKKILYSQTIDFLKMASKKMNVWSSNGIDLANLENTNNDFLLLVWSQPVNLASESDYEYHSIYFAKINIDSKSPKCSR
jgi:hypothetical protein